MLLTILVIQEEFLLWLPQVQLTVILIIVYAQFLSNKELYPLIIGYVILDNMIMGSFNLYYTPAMFFSWLLLAFVAKKLRNKSDYILLIVAVLFAFIYGWSFIPGAMLVQGFGIDKLWLYVKLDFPFELGMAFNSIVTFLLLYHPLNEMFKRLYHPNNLDNYQIFK